jgi:RNA polymerase sigma-70 factor, ECF subfamily
LSKFPRRSCLSRFSMARCCELVKNTFPPTQYKVEKHQTAIASGANGCHHEAIASFRPSWQNSWISPLIFRCTCCLSAMTSTSVTLLKRVRRREDQEAWTRFVVLYTPLLHRWARCAGLSESDAADLTQDVFVVLMNELPTFQYDASRGTFRAWLKTVTLNKCRERLRKFVETARGGTDDPFQDRPSVEALEAFWETEYRAHLVRKALEVMHTHFEPKTWQACWEQLVDGRTAAEVSRRTGLSEASVYVAKFRVLRRLRQELAGLLD